MSDLPHIPFVVSRTAEGDPIWTELDPHKLAHCIDNMLCIVCGEKLDSLHLFWIAPEKQVRMGDWLGEPPMHEACAHHAIRHCPHLRNPDAALMLVRGRGLVFDQFLTKPLQILQIRPLSFFTHHG